MDTEPPTVPKSKRKQRSEQRLLEYQQHKKLKLLWRRVFTKLAKMWRHQRMWNVHNAWFATRSASAEAAGPPASETVRMDVDSSANRASVPVEQQPAARAEGGLRAEAVEFAPGLPMAEVVSAWSEAVEMAAGRWQVTYHDLANVLSERSESVLMQSVADPLDTRPTDGRVSAMPAVGHHARSRSPASSLHSSSEGESDWG